MGTQFRLPGPYTMTDPQDQVTIDKLVKDIQRLFSTGAEAPGSTTLGVLMADTTNQKIYAKEGDEYIEVGNV